MWTIEFNECGGYDCMTGAWTIKHNGKTVVDVDQGDFGQYTCDYQFRSEEAKVIAKKIFKCLSGSK